MPTYKNTTAVDIVVGAIRFPAYTEVAMTTFLEGTLPTGLVKTSDVPNDNPVLLAEKYSALTGADLAVIDVPASKTKAYVISLYVESGEFTVALSEFAYDFTPPVRIAEGATFTRKYVSRAVKNINIHCVTGGKIYVNIYEA